MAILAPVITAAFSAIGSLIGAAITAWPVTLAIALTGIIAFLAVKFWSQIKEWATGLWDNITTFFSEHWQDMLLWIVSWPTALIKTLNDAGVWEKLGAWLGNIWYGIKNWFSDLGQKNIGVDTKCLEQLLRVPCRTSQKIGYWIGFAIGSIVKFFKDSKDAFVKFIKDAWDFVTVDILRIITEIIDWFSKLPGRIWE